MSDEAVGFVLRLGRALHRYGYSAHRLEEVLGAAAQRLGLEAQFFSTPTSVFAAFGPQEEQRTFLLRVEPGDVDLGKLARLDTVTRRVLRGELHVGDGSSEIERVVAAAPRYGAPVTTAAFALASGAAARFLGGGAREIAAATAIGLVTGLLAIGTTRVRGASGLFEPVAAFLAAAIASAAAVLVAPLSVYIATLAGLIVLIPGFTLTVAMTELTTRHLVSGTARLSAAFLIFLVIAFGMALGGKVVGSTLGAPPIVQPVPLPVWTEWLALLVAPVCFAVLLRAEPGDVPGILVTGILAFEGGRLGGLALGPELGVFAGALTIGVASNLYARGMDRSEQVTLVPGILLLVPGSIGFRSFASLLDQQVVLGVQTAFKMGLMAVALVAGLLIANIIAPPRRHA